MSLTTLLTTFVEAQEVLSSYVLFTEGIYDYRVVTGQMIDLFTKMADHPQIVAIVENQPNPVELQLRETIENGTRELTALQQENEKLKQQIREMMNERSFGGDRIPLNTTINQSLSYETMKREYMEEINKQQLSLRGLENELAKSNAAIERIRKDAEEKLASKNSQLKIMTELAKSLKKIYIDVVLTREYDAAFAQDQEQKENNVKMDMEIVRQRRTKLDMSMLPRNLTNDTYQLFSIIFKGFPPITDPADVFRAVEIIFAMFDAFELPSVVDSFNDRLGPPILVPKMIYTKGFTQLLGEFSNIQRYGKHVPELLQSFMATNKFFDGKLVSVDFAQPAAKFSKINIFSDKSIENYEKAKKLFEKATGTPINGKGSSRV